MNGNLQFESLSTEELLSRYLTSRDEEMKRELVLRYVYIVKTLAMQMRGVYVSIADIDDIVNEGIIALMDALSRFDPEKNVKFTSYASLRIRGAIIDYARKQDWTPRSVRKTAKEIDSATAQLQVQLGRAPTEAETAEKMGMSLDKYRKSLTDSSLYNLLSLDALIDDTQTEWNMESLTAVENSNDPARHLAGKELTETLRKAVLALKPREQMVLSLYFRKELNMKEIARILGVSEPRVSQIQSGALAQLRRAMEKYANA